MKPIRRFLFIAFGPNSLQLMYIYLMRITNEIGSRTYNTRPKIASQYFGNLLLGVILYLLIRKAEKKSAGDGWAMLVGFLPGLWVLIRLWSPVPFKMTFAMATLLSYGIPHMLMLNAVYACLLLRWIRTRHKNKNKNSDWI